MEDLQRLGVAESLWPLLCAASAELGGPPRAHMAPGQLVLHLPASGTTTTGAARIQALRDSERLLQHAALLAGVPLSWTFHRWRGGWLSIPTVPPSPDGWLLEEVLALGGYRARKLAVMPRRVR